MNVSLTHCVAFSVAVVLALVPLAGSSNDGVGAIRDIGEIQVNQKTLREAIASRTLTWLTGSSSNNDYVSVGRTANYFGFVGLRVASGQSLTRSAVANDTLAVLNESQREILVSLLADQKRPFEQTQTARYKINRALEGLLVGEQISQEAFLEFGRTYGASEAELGRVVGQRLGDVAQTLSSEQMSELMEIRQAHISGQGQHIERQRLRLRLPSEDKQELVNIAARLLSWTTGSQEFNDFEVVGKPSQHFGFVSLRVESNHGIKRGQVANAVWTLLTPSQQQMLDTAATRDAQRFGDFLKARAQLMRTLEVALSGKEIDTDQSQQFGEVVGEIEASMTWNQANTMLQVRNSLSDEQSSDLLDLRERYTAVRRSALPENSVERGRQLYAQCALCHNASSPQAVAPDLTGIVGREIAADATFDGYSNALRNYASVESVWSEAVLDSFIESPKVLIPGTYMRFDGLDAEAGRAALINYLKSKE